VATTERSRNTPLAWTTIRLSFRLFYRRLGIFLAGNVLWLVVSLPLITLPAATGGLFYLAYRVVSEERDLDPKPAEIGDFWVGLRSYWQRCTLLGLLNFVALAMLVVALLFYLGSPVEPFRWLIGPVFLILIVFLGMQIYLFALLIVSPEASIWSIFRQAFLLFLAYPFDNLLLLISLIVLTAISLALAGPVLLLLFSLLALIQTVALRLVRIERGEIPGSKSGE
jgi:uncharacterized membrane protein YesL